LCLEQPRWASLELAVGANHSAATAFCAQVAGAADRSDVSRDPGRCTALAKVPTQTCVVVGQPPLMAAV
jgi:hypothetical protein